MREKRERNTGAGEVGPRDRRVREWGENKTRAREGQEGRANKARRSGNCALTPGSRLLDRMDFKSKEPYLLMPREGYK